MRFTAQQHGESLRASCALAVPVKPCRESVFESDVRGSSMQPNVRVAGGGCELAAGVHQNASLAWKIDPVVGHRIRGGRLGSGGAGRKV